MAQGRLNIAFVALTVAIGGFLLGFDAPDGQDPVHAGYEWRADPQRDRVTAQVCIGDEIKTSGVTGGASDHVVKGWIRNGDLAKVIVRDRENGCWLSGADPRRVAYALGY